jgi:hypothetical protein
MLGFVVAPLGQKVAGQFPYGIQYAYGGEGNYLCPDDPQWNQRGEAGFFYDTRLGGLAGGIPTDAELGPVYGYTPNVGGWVNAAEGFFPAPWRVPGGWNSAGRYGPQMSLTGAMSSSSILLPIAVIAALGYGAYRFLKRKKK